MHPSPPVPAPPGLLLIRLSEEMAVCVQLLTVIELEVADLIKAAPLRNRPAPEALQKIDLLSQTLGDLSACLAGLGKVTFPAPGSADWAAPALGAIRLDDLRCRLTGQAVRQDPAQHEVEFF
ncbi:MAG: hypothetical protein INF93_05250 [Rhodobacter sp.]|jgi:hypothetical protein|nr:hypothetical protein [Rhodobacter sp.]